MNADQKAETRFAVFSAPEWGFRALCKLLLNYGSMYQLKTVRGIINRWAPPNENNTDAYVDAVANALGVSASDTLDLANDVDLLSNFAKAISTHEAGGWFFTDDDCLKGAQLALNG